MWGAYFQGFVDRLVSMKIKTVRVVTSCRKVSRQLKLRLIEATKIKTAKVSFEGLRVTPRKLAPTIISHYMVVYFQEQNSSSCHNHNILYALML